MEYQAQIGNGKPLNIEINDGGFTSAGQSVIWDIQPSGDNKYSIIINAQSLNAELVAIDKIAKKVTLKLNGELIDVSLKEKFDLLLDKMGLSVKDSGQLKEIKAPMPGLILDIKVSEGSEVKKGDALLVLEAMKMENVIKSPGEGVVKEILVKKAQSVDKGHVLIKF
jgi:biotin carboxyl carrier protein